MGEEAATGRQVSRARQLAERARLMKEARAHKLPGPAGSRETFSALRKERRSVALRRSISSPSRASEHDIVLMDEHNTPSTVKNALQRAALAQSTSTTGEIFANGANVPMAFSPTDDVMDQEEESPQQEQKRKEGRASFVRRGSVGEYGTIPASSMFCQQSNIPFGHMAAAATFGATATPAAGCTTGQCAPSLVVSPHSTVDELDQKLRALAARDERLGRILGEAIREQQSEADQTRTEATAGSVAIESQVALGAGLVESGVYPEPDRGRQTETDAQPIDAELDADSAAMGAQAQSDTRSDAMQAEAGSEKVGEARSQNIVQQ